jgi:hypothetical protein
MLVFRKKKLSVGTIYYPTSLHSNPALIEDCIQYIFFLYLMHCYQQIYQEAICKQQEQ